MGAHSIYLDLIINNFFVHYKSLQLVIYLKSNQRKNLIWFQIEFQLGTNIAPYISSKVV